MFVYFPFTVKMSNAFKGKYYHYCNINLAPGPYIVFFYLYIYEALFKHGFIRLQIDSMSHWLVFIFFFAETCSSNRCQTHLQMQRQIWSHIGLFCYHIFRYNRFYEQSFHLFINRSIDVVFGYAFVGNCFFSFSSLNFAYLKIENWNNSRFVSWTSFLLHSNVNGRILSGSRMI